MRLRDKVVAITGASSGIGRATAQLAAAEGAAVVVAARRLNRLDEVVQAIAAKGGRALAVKADVTSEADVQAVVEQAVAAYGALDVVICNAGIGYHGSLDDTPPVDMRRIVEVNLLGAMYTAHAAMPVFRRQGRGHIIVVSSFAGRRGIGGTSVYGASKAGLIAFVESLRSEFLGSGLRASVINPVGVDTEFRSTIGRDFGRTIEGAGPRQSAEHVAREIVDCIVTPRAEVYPLRKSWWIAVLSVVAPARADRFVKKFERRATPLASHADADS